MAEANSGHAVSYGADPWTARAQEILRGHFGERSQVAARLQRLGRQRRVDPRGLPALGGGHLRRQRARQRRRGRRPGARSRASSSSPSPRADGKLTPDDVRARVTRIGDEHAVQPRLVTITQSSEYGTRYSPEETAALAQTAHELGLVLHMDGSRLSNAAAGLGCGLGELAADVDVLSLGGTKNGMVLGEAVVFLDPGLRRGSALSAQADAPAGLQGPLSRRPVHRHVRGGPVAAQRRPRQRDGGAPGRTPSPASRGSRSPRRCRPTECSPCCRARRLTRCARGGRSTPGTRRRGEERLMCSWDTTPEEVDAFAEALAAACG